MANHDDDREVFEPGFRAWSLMSTVPSRTGRYARSQSVRLSAASVG
jgi:hypothetical protein